MSRAAIVLALVLWLAPTAAAPSNFPQTPEIRVSTRLVEIGVIVRDKNGPVSNLTKSDFTLLDRGKRQEISVFAADAAASAHQPPPQALPPNTFSDLPRYGTIAPRSVTVVLLDNLNTLYGSAPESSDEAAPYWVEDLALQNAKNHLIEFIKKLDPRDRVAIYGLRHTLHVLSDFTSDRERLLTILEKYDTRPLTKRALAEPGAWGGPGGGGVDSFENQAAMFRAGIVNGQRGGETMAALEEISAHLANIPGRKNLVWLTANLPLSGVAIAHLLGPANIAVYPVDSRGLLVHSMAGEFVPGTADANDFQAHNMPAQSAEPMGISTMQELAAETGGQAFVNTNDITGAIRKAVEDSAVTYTLGFYIHRDSLDGKFHEVKVEVRGKGLTLRYPKGYYALPDAPPSGNGDRFLLARAAESPIEFSSIPLKATVDRAGQPPHTLRLLCSIDARDLSFRSASGLRQGSLEVHVIDQDETGRVIGESGKIFTLEFPQKRYDAVLQSGVLLEQYVQVKASVSTVRVLVEDLASRKVGSVIIPLSQIN